MLTLYQYCPASLKYINYCYYGIKSHLFLSLQAANQGSRSTLYKQFSITLGINTKYSSSVQFALIFLSEYEEEPSGFLASWRVFTTLTRGQSIHRQDQSGSLEIKWCFTLSGICSTLHSLDIIALLSITVQM